MPATIVPIALSRAGPAPTKGSSKNAVVPAKAGNQMLD